MKSLIPLVDLKAQWDQIAAVVQPAMNRVVASAEFILGAEVAAFEDAFAQYCGAAHCVGVASGTDAIHLMLRALGIGPGDEVIVPAFTFVATALGVTLAGATPVLADVSPTDGLIDPQAVEAAISPRTAAVLCVHLYGRCANVTALREIADRHGLVFVEDAAQAHGAAWQGVRAGALGRAAAFSFYPGKNLGAFGDAGAVTTSDTALADRLRLLRNWGSRRKYFHEEVGFNSRLDTLQAAVLLAKLPFLDTWNGLRRSHADLYRQLLAGNPELTFPDDRPEQHCVQHLFVLRTRERDRLLEHLRGRGVQAGVHYPFPIHRLQAFEQLGQRVGAFPQAENWANECLSLPMFPELQMDQIRFIAAQLMNGIRTHSLPNRSDGDQS